jgi:beta-galactosidase
VLNRNNKTRKRETQMKRFRFFIIAAWLLTSMASLLCECQSKPQEQATAKPVSAKLDFNRGWSFMKSPAEWPVEFNAANKTMEPVILPHTWNAEDMGPGLTHPYIRSGWYHKVFAAPELREGQRLLVEFEGVNNCHKVWVNGGYAGGRDGGFLSSLYDLTELLKVGENTMLVRADNSYTIKAGMPEWIGWNRYGGITRPVWLHIREHAYIAGSGVEIRTPEVSPESATTVVRSYIEETRTGGTMLTVKHTLTSPGGRLISTTTMQLKSSYCLSNTIEIKLPAIVNPELWSDVNPVLYTLNTEILEGDKVLDLQENRIGYRFFHFDSEKGFTLNGKPTKLKGANIHIYFPGLGNALPDRFHTEEMKLMKQMGCNYMRASHYPRPKATLDACDELGILVMEEQPYWHGSVRSSGGEEAIDNASRLIREMVRQHGNHPSIIIWNTVNEIMIAPPYKPGVGYLPADYPGFEAWKMNPGEYPYLRRHLQKMVETFKEVDPGRPVSMVVGGQWQKNDVAGLTAIADIVAYNGGAMNFSMKGFTGPETGKNYEFTPDYFREIYPDRIHIMSEGILNDFYFARGDWDREQAGWRVNAKYWSTINQRPWFCGGSMWCFTDYSYYSPKIINRFTDVDQNLDTLGTGILDRHGVVDMYRLPKDLFYFYEAMWSDHPVLHILGHWNHEKGSSREVVVFTNCRDVELILNGQSLGKGTSCKGEFPGIENAPLVWKNVAFENGKLEAIGKSRNQKMTDLRITAGKPEQILLSSSNELIADGRDISYIDLKITDSKGNRCYTANDTLTVKVSGAARLGGASEIMVSGGLARIAIRSTGETGDVKVTAKDKGLKDGELIVKSLCE